MATATPFNRVSGHIGAGVAQEIAGENSVLDHQLLGIAAFNLNHNRRFRCNDIRWCHFILYDCKRPDLIVRAEEPDRLP